MRAGSAGRYMRLWLLKSHTSNVPRRPWRVVAVAEEFE